MYKHKCIYIHIPKTAGTSVLAALGQTGMGRNHFSWYVYNIASPKKFKKYYKFAFVRNPWTRLYSVYNYLKLGGNQKEDISTAKIINKYNDLNHFIVNGLGKGLFLNNPMFLPQSYFILGIDGKLKVDYVGRYEFLDSDFEIIAKKLKIESKLPKLNITKKNDLKKIVLSDEARDIMFRIYRQDFEYFKYEINIINP